MKMKAAKLLIAAGLAAGGLYIGVGEAHMLNGCWGSWNAGSSTWTTECSGGSGNQRAWINCNNGTLQTYLGSTAGVNSLSTTWCVSGSPTGDMGWDLPA